MLKQKNTVYALLSIFSLYFITVLLKSDFWGNLLSPVVAAISAFIILRSIKKINNYRYHWILFFFFTLAWTIADCLWLVFDNILLIDPMTVNLITILYTLPNLFLAISLTVYYIYHFKKWNLYQLALDAIAIDAILFILLWTFILSKAGLKPEITFEYINTMIYIFLDFYLVSGVIIICVSTGIKNINRGFLFVFAGILTFTFADFYYSYLYLTNRYQANRILDGIYMLCNILFALGAIYEASRLSSKQKAETAGQYTLTEGYRKAKYLNCILILFSCLYIVEFFSFEILMISTLIIILHQVLTTHVQVGIRDRTLLENELEMNKHLEKTVRERTQELTEANKYLDEISKRDALTGLYNRRYLINYLDLLITNNMNKPFALLYIDIDRFKSINDSYGHEIGDEVLCALSSRFLKNCMPNCTAFRAGGDEFVLLIEDYMDKSYIKIVAEKLIEIIQRPVSIYPYIFTSAASIGIVSYPEDARDRDILMKYADIAMYEAKNKHHGNTYLFFDSALSKKIERKHEIELLLKNADYDKEFILHYQPQYRISDHLLVGMEILIKWMHPEKGLISPMEFIPIAEESGTIVDIGEWVIDKAFYQIKKWNETYSCSLKMGINISPIQIENTNFINYFQEKLCTENINPIWIDLEITEGSAMKANVSIEQIFTAFANIGISTSLDDFGTGYSSLSYIKRFDIDRLKIAKELIDNINEDKNTLLIVRAIIMMARGLGLKTIAEGVENTKQLEILDKLGCDEIQGYIFGKPVPVDEFEKEHINKAFHLNRGTL